MIIPYVFRVETAEDLEIQLNLILAPLTNKRIYGVELGQAKNDPFFTQNLFAALTTDSGTPLGAPFQFKVFSYPTEQEALDKLNQFMVANAAYFFSSVYVVYRPHTPNPNQGVSIGIFYNSAGAGAAVNWGGGTIATGIVGGDLSGTLPNPTVVGIQGVPVQAGPYAAGQQLTYDAVSAQWLPYVVQYYASLAVAAANQAAQIIGQQIIILPTSPQSGTYILTGKTGNITDYTKISDLTDVASEVGIDAPIPGLPAANVYQALQVLTGVTVGTALATSTTDMVVVAVADISSVIFEFTFVRGTVRYSGTMNVTHDGTTPVWTVLNVVGTSLPFDVSVGCVISGADLKLQAINAGAACDFRVRTRFLPA